MVSWTSWAHGGELGIATVEAVTRTPWRRRVVKGTTPDHFESMTCGVSPFFPLCFGVASVHTNTRQGVSAQISHGARMPTH